MPRGALADSAVLAWWALGRFVSRSGSKAGTEELLKTLTDLGLGAFRGVRQRMTGVDWSQTEGEPPGKWAGKLKERLAPLAFHEQDPETCWNRPWDRQWRLVAFDLPAKPHARRQKLWRWLKENRLGLLQRSLWISAKPLEEIRNLFQEAANSHTLLLWEAPTPTGLHPVSIVTQAWDLATLDSDYQAVLNLTHEDPSPENLRRATFRWQKAVQGDPLLPRSLYPKSFRGFRATEQLEKMWSKFRVSGA